MDKYECVVCGAGPAGLSAARELAKLGVSFTVLEKNKGIETSKNWISWKKNIKEEGLENCIVNTPAVLRFRSFLGPSYDLRNSGAVILDEDKVLKEMAGPVKTHLSLGTEFLSWSRSKEGYKVRTSKGAIETNYIIDGMGNQSPILTAIGRRCNRFMGCYACLLDNVAVDEPDLTYIYDSFFPGNYYFWIMPHSRKRVMVGAFSWFSLERGGFKESLERYMKHQDAYKGKGKVIRTYAGNIPLEPMNDPVFENILFVGDTASQALPSSGFSLHRCLSAGKLAAAGAAEKNPKAYSEHWNDVQDIGITTHNILSHIISNITNLKLSELIRYMPETPPELIIEFLSGSRTDAKFCQNLLTHTYNNFTLRELKGMIEPKEYLDIIGTTYNQVRNYTRRMIRKIK